MQEKFQEAADKMKKYFLFLFIFIFLFSNVYANDTCAVQGADSCLDGTDIAANNVFSEDTLQYENMPAEDHICIIYFYGRECSKCAKVKPLLEDIEEKYGEKIVITRYEIYHDLKNYQMYNEFCNVQSIQIEERGVPFIAIADKYYMGLSQIEDNLEEEIEYLLENEIYVCPMEGEMACHIIDFGKNDTNPAIQDLETGITLPLVLGTGLVDGINPCAFAVLIFLITFLISISGNKKRMLKAGIVYVAAVYITYYFAGLGLLSIIQVSGFSGIIVNIAAIVAILAGLVNIKDYFFYGKGFSLEIPASAKGTIEKWTHKANIPAAIVLGFLVSMFELPCTGGVYLAIIAMLANTVTKMQAIVYLLLYNLMFVIPLLIILGLVLFGMKAEHIESWRQKKRHWMKLAMGLLLLGLGVLMLLGII